MGSRAAVCACRQAGRPKPTILSGHPRSRTPANRPTRGLHVVAAYRMWCSVPSMTRASVNFMPISTSAQASSSSGASSIHPSAPACAVRSKPEPKPKPVRQASRQCFRKGKQTHTVAQLPR